MIWQREDTAYCAATFAAIAVLIYFIAANFGLVPTPLGAGARDSTLTVDVPVLVAQTGAISPPVFAVRKKSAAHGARPAPADHTPPSVAMSIRPGSHLPASSKVTGTAADDGTGVRRVDVVYTPRTGQEDVYTATLSCGSTAGRRCAWSVDLPSAAGGYSVAAFATDRASNLGRAGPIDISVDGASGSSGGAVGGTVKTVGGLVDTVGSTLRSLLGNGPR